MAERVGFEPTVVFATTVFKTVPLSLSGTSPQAQIVAVQVPWRCSKEAPEILPHR